MTGIAFDPTAPSPISLRVAPRAERDRRLRGPREHVHRAVVDARRTSSPACPTPRRTRTTSRTAWRSTARASSTSRRAPTRTPGLQSPNYPETPLSAAILRADIHAPGFDGNVTYSPATTPVDDNVDQTGGDVSVFAAGTRNPYDLVVHSNGKIYATDNGPAGPNTSTSCTTSGTGVSSVGRAEPDRAGQLLRLPEPQPRPHRRAPVHLPRAGGRQRRRLHRADRHVSRALLLRRHRGVHVERVRRVRCRATW